VGLEVSAKVPDALELAEVAVEKTLGLGALGPDIRNRISDSETLLRSWARSYTGWVQS
jgi:hypothetical protein